MVALVCATLLFYGPQKIVVAPGPPGTELVGNAKCPTGIAWVKPEPVVKSSHPKK